MFQRLPPIQSLRSFESAARHSSFKLAALELNVTPAAISQQVKVLEDYLGVALFRRLSRRLEITVEGEAMLPKLREAFGCIVEAIEAARDPGSRLLIMAPPNFAARWLVPNLSDFARRHPDIEFQLSSSVDAIDRYDAGNPHLMPLLDHRIGYTEVAIRFGAAQCPGYQVDPVLAPDYTLVCSPALLNGAHPLRTPDDLRWHVLIDDQAIPGESLRPSWEEWLQAAGASTVDATQGLRFGNSTLALEAALNGQGVVLAPEPLVAAEVAAGRLVMPFDIKVPSRFCYYLATPQAAVERPAARAFRAWLLAQVRSMPTED
ncbi:MAG: LysR family transcriptional regulator [Rhodocyclales bacterium GT-UBC]|nr:MAG: LysR family transcriptional regulator [Rhodocyclales bacterium GT-UBC]